MAKEKSTTQIAGEQIAERAKRSWGDGWTRISNQQKIETVSHMVMGTILGQVSGAVEVATVRAIWNEAVVAAGIDS